MSALCWMKVRNERCCVSALRRRARISAMGRLSVGGRSLSIWRTRCRRMASVSLSSGASGRLRMVPECQCRVRMVMPVEM